MTDTVKSAVISDCGKYRYRLARQSHDGYGDTVIIMVNPSTADADNDDATIRKLMGFASRHGWFNIVVGNLFAYRATDVRELAKADSPIGPENDKHLEEMIRNSIRLIFAWGPAGKVPARLRNRWKDVYRMAQRTGKDCYSIGPTAQDGHPCHPLMLPYSHKIQTWTPPL